MAVLISLLLPALANVQEVARRVNCQSNAHQIGAAIQMYAQHYRGHMPYSSQFVGDPSAGQRLGQQASHSGRVMLAADTMMTRISFDPSESGYSFTRRPGEDEEGFQWDGLGILFHEQYLSHPGVCYCPSHRGNHHLATYSNRWAQQADGRIAINYQYRVPAETSVIDELSPYTTIMTDGLETKQDYNHIVGSTTLRADASVSWYEDEGGVLYNSLPDATDTGMGNHGGTSKGSGRDDPEGGWRRIDAYQSRDD